MSNPNRVLIWMAIFLFGVTTSAAVLYQPLSAAFMANQVFNGMILAVLLAGIVVNFRQVIILHIDVVWINTFLEEGERAAALIEPRLLSPIAKMLSKRGRRGFAMTAMTMRSLLDGIRMRLDESRDISRYLTGLLIFLGLLGTFWGLLDTVSGVAGVISGLSHQDGADAAGSFAQLIATLEEPLSGMGTAFSSSLFGLAGALAVGFLDLQAGHAQNRFFNDLEDWLSELAHLPGGAIASGESERSLPGYIEALMEQTAENLDQLQRVMTRTEEERSSDFSKQMELNSKIAALTDQMREQQKLIERLAKSQSELSPVLSRLNETLSEWGGDEVTRSHLRNLDVALTRMLGEVTSGREKMTEELRRELRLLGHTLPGQRPER